MKIVLDMDPGVDDAVALIMALGSEDVEILGVSIVSGNVHVDQGVINALRVASYLGKRIEVYRGSDKPLIRDLVTSEHVHGLDGLGDAGIPIPIGHNARENAVGFIVETALREKISVIATGPLTNIAKAILAEPSIASKLEEIVVMGGSFGLTKYGKGNVTPYAEYNFYVDPEAAKIVIRSGAKIRIVGLDVTQNPEAALTRERAEELRRIGGRAGDLIYRITHKPLTSRGYFELHDAIAMASKLDPRVVVFKELYVSIDTCFERGRSYPADPISSDGKASVGYDIDVERFYQILREALK